MSCVKIYSCELHVLKLMVIHTVKQMPQTEARSLLAILLMITAGFLLISYV